jgi:hypothetical protein
MNIFFLSRDIEENVRFHADKHVVKMILESAQLLSSVHHCTGTGNEQMYKLTHKNHPDAVWARSSKENYAYLISLAILLGEEYTFRYGKVHKSIGVIEQMPWPSGVVDGVFTEPPKCVHDDFKGIEDTVEAYRAYYRRDKRDICTWKRREIPAWF